MIGLVLVTHGRLAVEFLSAVEHVVGPQPGARAICIGPDDDMERRRKDIVEAVGAVDDGSGVILLTDMFGGTPRPSSATQLAWTSTMGRRWGAGAGLSIGGGVRAGRHLGRG